jgi:hypothetical protein
MRKYNRNAETSRIAAALVEDYPGTQFWPYDDDNDPIWDECLDDCDWSDWFDSDHARMEADLNDWDDWDYHQQWLEREDERRLRS